MPRARAVLGDVLGAFADGGILFPLLVLLCLQGCFSAPILFATAGFAYLASGWFFKIPMSVQPLKAIAIAAVAMGASGAEIRLSGALLGATCLLLTFADVNLLAKRIPHSLIHCVQLGLGVILFLQGVSIFSQSSQSSQSSMLHIGLAFVLSSIILLFSSKPLLGLIASAALVASLFFPSIVSQSSTHAVVAAHGIRALTILALVCPQLALTLTNSVVATADVAKRYYTEEASRVTERSLLVSIGMGNLVSASVGGLPYCHGCGGVTAHYRGGARSSLSNVVMGVFLLSIASYTLFSARTVVVGYPDFVLASLLIAVGVFHMGLARATWQTALGKFQLAAALLAATVTRNMLVVLVVAAFAEWIKSHVSLNQNVKAGVL